MGVMTFQFEIRVVQIACEVEQAIRVLYRLF
jgi:hypothetical protein